MRVLVPLHVDPTPPALGACVHALHGRSMGTTWTVRLAGSRGCALEPLRAAVQAVLDEVVAQMSPWEADSDISRYNRAPAGTRHALPEGFRRVMAAALAVARESEGAFDPTAGELVDLWGFGPPGPVAMRPADAMLHDAATRAGWQRLRLDDGALLQPGGARLDLSAIAKGHGVDRVSERLRRLGHRDHLVEVGGELRGAGVRPDGQPWWVDLLAPPGAERLPATRIALHGLSVATSGDYLRHAQDEDGRRVSHTVDPRSGRPIAHGVTSVSVLHADAMWADAWSTALTVLGPRQGLALATRLELAAVIVHRTDDGGCAEVLSPALQALAQ